MRNEAVALFIASHETSANTLAWVWYLLDGDSNAASKLQDELEIVLQGRQPRLEDVPKLVYTRAVIEETLRLYLLLLF